MADKAHYVGEYRTPITSLTAANGQTGAVVVWRPRPAPVQDATGAWVDGTRVRGSRLHALGASSFSASVRNINLFRAFLASKTSSLAIASATTITRSDAGGDFLADGWQPGQRSILLDTDFRAVDGGLSANITNRKPVTITGVAAQTLTFAASTFTTGLGALPATVGLYRCAGVWNTCPIAAGAGNVGGTPPQDLLSNTYLPWMAAKPDKATLVGADSLWLAAVAGTALPAGEVIDFMPEGADY